MILFFRCYYGSFHQLFIKVQQSCDNQQRTLIGHALHCYLCERFETQVVWTANGWQTMAMEVVKNLWWKRGNSPFWSDWFQNELLWTSLNYLQYCASIIHQTNIISSVTLSFVPKEGAKSPCRKKKILPKKVLGTFSSYNISTIGTSRKETHKAGMQLALIKVPNNPIRLFRFFLIDFLWKLTPSSYKNGVKIRTIPTCSCTIMSFW